MSREFDLPYGSTSIRFVADDDGFALISDEPTADPPLTDVQIGAAFDSPIASPPLDEIAGSDDSVLIVVSDATRATASAHVVNLLVRRLVQAGVSPANMAVGFSARNYRRGREEEKSHLLTPLLLPR